MVISQQSSILAMAPPLVSVLGLPLPVEGSELSLPAAVPAAVPVVPPAPAPPSPKTATQTAATSDEILQYVLGMPHVAPACGTHDANAITLRRFVPQYKFTSENGPFKEKSKAGLRRALHVGLCKEHKALQSNGRARTVEY